MPPAAIPQIMFGSIGNFALLAVPFFIFAGELMARGGMARRLIVLVMAMFGGFRGSLPITTVGAAALYGSISGSTAATVAALGPLFYPQLRKSGYNEKFSTGVITCAGYLDNIIPPSIAMILYCAAAEQSVIKLFAAGIIPGLVLAALMAIYIYLYARTQNVRGGRAFHWHAFAVRLRTASGRSARRCSFLAGSMAACFRRRRPPARPASISRSSPWSIHREISWREFWDVSVTSMVLTAQIFLIVAVAGVFSWLSPPMACRGGRSALSSASNCSPGWCCWSSTSFC